MLWFSWFGGDLARTAGSAAAPVLETSGPLSPRRRGRRVAACLSTAVLVACGSGRAPSSIEPAPLAASAEGERAPPGQLVVETDAGVPALDPSPAASAVPTPPLPPTDAVASPRPGGASFTCRRRIAAPLPPHSVGACRGDDDCAARPHGRCIVEPTRASECVYDECSADEDCARGRCSCAPLQEPGQLHRCLVDTCRADDHCAPGQTCATEHAFRRGGYLGRRFCTTPGDGCKPWSDGVCGPSAACIYGIAARRWICDASATRGMTE